MNSVMLTQVHEQVISYDEITAIYPALNVPLARFCTVGIPTSISTSIHTLIPTSKPNPSQKRSNKDIEEIEKAMTYRTAKLITHYWSYSYAIAGVAQKHSCCLCPTCDYPLEREYADFCCGCGQRLKWGNARKLVFKEDPNFGDYKV